MKIIGECIEFQGYRNPKGYGQIKIGGRKGKVWLAHRWAWTQVHGNPGEMCVLHGCDNPACINVDHLFLGTIGDNNRDMTAKGRHAPQHPNFRHRGRFTAEQVAAIRASNEPQVALAERYGCTPSNVSHIKRGKTYPCA